MNIKMNLEQYQQLYFIPTGSTGDEYTQSVLDIFEIDGSKYNLKEIKEIINSITIPKVDKLKNYKIKIEGKKYSIVKDIMKATFNEWIQYESIVGVSPSEEDIIKNLHKILSVFVRPTKRLGGITPLDDIDIDKNEEAMKKMKIKDAISINVFFYLKEMDFITNTKRHYLNQRIRKTQVKAGS